MCVWMQQTTEPTILAFSNRKGTLRGNIYLYINELFCVMKWLVSYTIYEGDVRGKSFELNLLSGKMGIGAEWTEYNTTRMVNRILLKLQWFSAILQALKYTWKSQPDFSNTYRTLAITYLLIICEIEQQSSLLFANTSKSLASSIAFSLCALRTVHNVCDVHVICDFSYRFLEIVWTILCHIYIYLLIVCYSLKWHYTHIL